MDPLLLLVLGTRTGSCSPHWAMHSVLAGAGRCWQVLAGAGCRVSLPCPIGGGWIANDAPSDGPDDNASGAGYAAGFEVHPCSLRLPW
jgi:hypothetical protein